MSLRIALALITCALAAPGLSAQSISSVTCGRSPCPPTLELADGETATITLSGRGLTSLVSGVAIDSSGRRVDGLTVELARSRSSSRRDVRITARDAPALTGLELQFRTDRRRTLTAPLRLATAAAPMTLVPLDPEISPPDQDPNQTATSIDELTATPDVTAADQSRVRVWVEGPAVPVVLRGAALDRVTGAHVRHSGRRVPDVEALVSAGGDPTRLELSLSARGSAQTPWGEEMEVVVEGPDAFGRSTSYPAPVRVVAARSIRADDPLFVEAAGSLLDQADALFRSCGVPNNHGFTVQAAELGHVQMDFGRAMSRLEHTTTPSQRITFLETHSLQQWDAFNPEQFRSFGSTAHPSPIPHTVSDVRLCLLETHTGPWQPRINLDATGVELLVRIGLDDVRFRSR
ncbi:MAG: hypothetical protein RLN75_05735, partial [Longimicrobiales bacterium]